MSEPEREFIRKATSQWWWFWLYFWRWPRLLRSLMAELESAPNPALTISDKPEDARKLMDDLEMAILERDEAFKVRDIAVKQTKNLLAWIHTTHRLGNVPKEGIRALFAAGIRLKVVLLFFVTVSAFGQAPPLLRNWYDTNVTGVADPRWTNVASGSTVLGPILTPMRHFGLIQFATNRMPFVGEINSLFTVGYPRTDIAKFGTNTGSLFVLGDHGVDGTSFTNNCFNIDAIGNGTLSFSQFSNSKRLTFIGVNSGAFSEFDGANRVIGIGADAFNTVRVGGTTENLMAVGSTIFQGAIITNVSFTSLIGIGSAESSTLINVMGLSGFGLAPIGSAVIRTNFGLLAVGNYPFQSSAMTNTGDINCIGALYPGNYLVLNNVSNLIICGYEAMNTGQVQNAKSIQAIGYQAMEGIRITNCTGIFAEDYNVLKDATLQSCSFIAGIGYDSLEDANLSNVFNMTAIGGALQSAHFTNCQNIIAMGVLCGTNLAMTGASNIFLFGNLLSAIPTNSEFWFGNSNNVYRFPGTPVIQTLTAPTVGQILTARDTSGTVGWSNAPSAGGGATNAINSIYTNNVLAGGPDLTQLEFTNSATVTWGATTNAGRVTMTATSAGGGSGIATNNGTGWNTTLLNVTNTTASTTRVPLTVQEIASQTADLQQWLTDTGTTNALLNSNGVLLLANGSIQQPTVTFFNNRTNGFYSAAATEIDLAFAGVNAYRFGSTAFIMDAGQVQFVDILHSSAGFRLGVGRDVSMYRLGAQQMAIGTGQASGLANLSASNGLFMGVLSVTNGLKVGLVNQATITNILSGSATLNFASQTVGGSEDLPITVTGASDGDPVHIGYESTVATGIIGSFTGWASNGVVFVRFISTGTTQNPNSGVFKVVVTKF